MCSYLWLLAPLIVSIRVLGHSLAIQYGAAIACKPTSTLEDGADRNLGLILDNLVLASELVLQVLPSMAGSMPDHVDGKYLGPAQSLSGQDATLFKHTNSGLAPRSTYFQGTSKVLYMLNFLPSFKGYYLY